MLRWHILTIISTLNEIESPPLRRDCMQIVFHYILVCLVCITHAHLAKQLHVLPGQVSLLSHVQVSRLFSAPYCLCSALFVVFSAFVPRATCYSFGTVEDEYIPWIGYSALEFLPETDGIRHCFNAGHIYMYLRMALTTLREKKTMVHTSGRIRESIWGGGSSTLPTARALHSCHWALAWSINWFTYRTPPRRWKE